MKNKTETINIIFSSDKNYAQLMGVAICSIFENKKGNYPIDIYVLDGGISKRDTNRLKIIEIKYNFKINYIKINTLFFKDFYITSYFSQAAYYRIMIPKLLPNLKKVLYLDCDIIVLDDIYELYNTDISNYLFAAVKDIYLDRTRHELLNIPPGEIYFNSGVLLINIEKCNDINATETILKFINDNPQKLKFVDQDALNATMWGNFLCIEQKYNYFCYLIENPHLNVHIEIKDIKILHYSGKKPWDYLSKNPLNEKYFYYLKKTPWKNLKYKNKTIKNISAYYKNLYEKKTQHLSFNLALYSQKKLTDILTKKNIDKIKIIKRKLGIKFYQIEKF